jgi:hypothetical protein
MNVYTIINESIETDFKHDSGYVYFLIKGSEVVYVGQTVDLHTRLNSHKRNKDFDKYNFIRCNPCDMDAIESVYIHALSPSLNGKALGNGKKFDSEEKVAPINLTDLCSMLVEYNDMKNKKVG